jgi:hypothetical protein
MLALYSCVTLETISVKERINVVDKKEEFFKDYDTLLDIFYGNFKAGAITIYIFWVDDAYMARSMQC